MTIIFCLFGVMVTFFNARWVKRNARKYILEKPELEEGYNKMYKAYIIYGNVPWVIIAIGYLSGLTNSIADFSRPSEMNPIVLIFYAAIVLFLILSVWWIYFKDGAEFLENHPGLVQKNSFFSGRTDMTAKEIKTMLPLMILGGIAALVMMWFGGFPTLK